MGAVEIVGASKASRIPELTLDSGRMMVADVFLVPHVAAANRGGVINSAGEGKPGSSLVTGLCRSDLVLLVVEGGGG